MKYEGDDGAAARELDEEVSPLADSVPPSALVAICSLHATKGQAPAMSDPFSLATPLARESFFAFVRELFELCDAPFDAREDDGEKFSEYERGSPPSYTSREGCRWKSGERGAEVRLHVEYFNPRDGEWSQLEGEVRGLPGGARVELESNADDPARIFVRARVFVGEDDTNAHDRWRRMIDDAAAAASVLGANGGAHGARGAARGES